MDRVGRPPGYLSGVRPMSVLEAACCGAFDLQGPDARIVTEAREYPVRCPARPYSRLACAGYVIPGRCSDCLADISDDGPAGARAESSREGCLPHPAAAVRAALEM